jgi:two-component system chemotaxis response regulator CheB
MFALPPEIRAHEPPQVTGVTCPDCAGTLQVERQGHKAHLHFACRIGHTYSVTELLSAKEQRLEERLWATLLALEEYATLLENLAPQAARECGANAGSACQDRRSALRSMARAVRELIEKDRPLSLSQDVPETGAGAQQPVGPERPT